MSVHTVTRGNGSRSYKVRWREGSANCARIFDRQRDARAFDVEVRRRRQQGGTLAVAQLTSTSPTLDEWIEQRWSVEHGATLADSTRDRYASVYRGYVRQHTAI